VKGRQLLVDTHGLLLKVLVSAAAAPDRDGARRRAHAVRLDGPHVPRRSLVCSWSGPLPPMGGQLVEDLRPLVGWPVAVVNRSATQPRSAFAVQPPRWIVARTFGWVGGFRRLSTDDEDQVESSEALIYAAMSRLMLRTLTRSSAPSSPAGYLSKRFLREG
jgi:transposase